jgi:hypothetical protein
LHATELDKSQVHSLLHVVDDLNVCAFRPVVSKPNPTLEPEDGALVESDINVSNPFNPWRAPVSNLP